MGWGSRDARWWLATVATAALSASPADAHGFGQRYDLPLPLSLYLFGAAAAVAVTFLIVALVVRSVPERPVTAGFDLLSMPATRWIAHEGVGIAVRLAVLALFVATMWGGFFGNQDPFRNIAPTLVWIIWWVGFAYVSAFVGDLLPLISPWRTAFDGAAWVFRRLAGRDLALNRPYPAALDVWPACIFLLAFSWIELVYPSPAAPLHIAWLMLGYSLVTWTAMIWFGPAWLAHAEVFTVTFGTFARFAPTRMVRDPPQWTLRPFAAGLLEAPSVSTSMTAFVLLLLATVLYDGILGTPEWTIFERAAVAVIGPLGELAPMVIRTAGLLAFWLAFLGTYLGVCALMGAVTERRLSPLAMAQSFALTLVPIVIGYHLAHYLTFLLIQGQYIVPLMSDPFGYGWNLFGTAGYRIDIAVVGARFTWYTAVTAILIGHIAAVYLAHVKAMQTFPLRAPALRSQVPLTALMVIYTFVSLSILAEPIVERRAPAQPSTAAPAEWPIPADAVLPESGTGVLHAIGPGRLAKQKLTYRVLASAFHDGTRMNAADLLYGYMFAYRWGVRKEAADQPYDPVVDAASADLRAHLAGVRIVGTDTASKSFRVGEFEVVRELIVVDIYTTFAPIDPDLDAAVAPPWSTLPWHVLVLMEEAVERGWAAFSQEAAARHGVDWLDLVRSDSMNQRLASLVATFARDGYRPDRLQSLVGVDEARKRWSALAEFYQQHGHFLVTNGPYLLKGWSADSVTLDVFRDLSYPLGVGSYDAYAVARRGFITNVKRDGDRLTISGDIETVMKFQRDYRIVRSALPSVAPEVRRRASPECRYMVVDETGRVALAGTIPLAEDSTFQLDLAGKLVAGRYTMLAEIAVNGNVMNADIRRIPLVVPLDR
jgi:hypothetical protein